MGKLFISRKCDLMGLLTYNFVSSLIESAQKEIKDYYAKNCIHSLERKESVVASRLYNQIEKELRDFHTSLETLQLIMKKWIYVANGLNQEIKECGDLELLCESIDALVAKIVTLKSTST